MSRYDDLFDLIEETNDSVEEILEYARNLEKKLEEALALMRELKK
jgi:predicted DNA-binding ArsR family transcriptional regulator